MENTVIQHINQLSKNEKLLLVEALWDSIAEDPSTIELPESHKKEIQSRLDTLEEDSKTAISWDSFVKQFSWSPMPFTLSITTKAQKDVSKAYEWYEDKVTGLGFEFIQNVDARIKHIARKPQHFQLVYGNSVRRALVSRFPFAIYFVEKDTSLIVFAILH